MNIRGQLAVASVALALVPMAVAGTVAYTTARSALEDRIRFNLETLANLAAERLDRLLLEREQNLKAWSNLRFIQDDTVTGDADGRISQFLQEAKRNFDFHQEIWVANAAGTVITSTAAGLRGRDVIDRPWFIAARRGEPWTGSPALQDLTGRVGMPLAFPIAASFDRAKNVGAIVTVIDWPKVTDMLHAVKVLPEGQNERGYSLLVDAKGVILAGPAFLSDLQPGQSTLASLGLDAIEHLPPAASGSATIVIGDQPYLVGYATTQVRLYSPNGWRMALLMRSDVAFAPLSRLLWTVVLLSGVLAVAFGALSVYWARQFSRPITSLVPFLRAVADGDLSQHFSIERGDELGMLADAASEMAQRLRSLIQDLQKAALHITTASNQVLTAAERHAAGSIHQASSIAQVTETMEQLTGTAKQIAHSATAVESLADDSARAAHSGYGSVNDALEAMEKIRRRVGDISGKTIQLGERSHRITEVLNLIKEIADEIHLLAVNAAIESAAAGEHGKRFSVVASEVRRLAERARASTEEIKGIVGEIQSATQTSVVATEHGVKEVESGVSVATRARGSLEQILQAVDRTTVAIREITAATQQQRGASEQIVETMREVAEVTRQAAASTQQSADAVAELNVLADQFKTRIKEFKL